MGKFKALFVYFRPFLIPITISSTQMEKAQMVYLGFKPGAAGWWAQTKLMATAYFRLFSVFSNDAIKPQINV